MGSRCSYTTGISLSYYLRNKAKNGRSGFRLPPSPKGLPILGNVLDIPLQNCQQGYSRWAKELSEYIFSSLLSKN
jgi:hypothetical protein